MKSALRDGKLPPPMSFAAAKSRHQQLLYEIGKIERQMADPKRPDHIGKENYELWFGRASSALGYMKKEADQLAVWLDRHPDSDLFREAYVVLKRLQDEVDLDPNEIAVVARLDAYYALGETATPVPPDGVLSRTREE